MWCVISIQPMHHCPFMCGDCRQSRRKNIETEKIRNTPIPRFWFSYVVRFKLWNFEWIVSRDEYFLKVLKTVFLERTLMVLWKKMLGCLFEMKIQNKFYILQCKRCVNIFIRGFFNYIHCLSFRSSTHIRHQFSTAVCALKAG